MVSNDDSRVKLRLVAEEISFARILASNEKRLRDRGVKRLRRFLIARSQRGGAATKKLLTLCIGLSKDDYLRLWKGLFYCMWMSDKPLVQEQLAEDISLLVHCFSTFKESLNFVECFFSALSTEWYGIDQLRMDKFMMLVRRFVRQSLVLVSKIDWRTEEVKSLADYFYKILTTAPIGLCMHIVEIYCEELAKVGEGKLSSNTIVTVIYPFAKYLSTQKDGRLISAITRCIFLYLIRQTEKGIEHQMKYSIWKEHGFVGGSIDAVQKVEDGDDDDNDEDNSDHDGADIDDDLMDPDSEEEELDKEQKYEIDARAGRVDVLLPPLDFDPQSFVKVFNELKNHKETTTKARKTVLQLIDKFTKLRQGKYPLGLQKVEISNKHNKKAEVEAAARRLMKEDYEMNAEVPNGLEDDDDDDDDGHKMSLSKSQKRVVTTVKNKTEKEKEYINKWIVCDVSRKKNGVKPILNKGWKVSNLDSSAMKGVKRKHEEGEISKSSGKFIITELNTIMREYKKKKSKTEENIRSNTLKKQAASESVNNMSIETCSISIQDEECNAESICTVEKQSNISSKLKQNTPKKGKVKENVENLSNTNGVNINEMSLKMSGWAKANGNISKTKISDWGGEWDGPLEDGETEIIIIPTMKRKMQPTPSASHVETINGATPENRINKLLSAVTPSNSGSKKVEFVLARNTAQEVKDYKRTVKNNSKIPFSAEKKPVQGVLKTTPVSSPVNPFYRLSDSFKCF